MNREEWLNHIISPEWDDGDSTIPHKYRKDKAFMLIVLSHYGFLLDLVPRELRNDKELVTAAVSNYARALKYASPRLRGDYDVVYAAVKSNGSALQYASESLKANKSIVHTAVSHTGTSILWASQDLQNNKDIFMSAINPTYKGSAYIFSLILPKFMNKAHILKLVAINPAILVYLTEEFKNDVDIVLVAVKTHGLCIKYAGQKARQNWDIAVAACISTPDAIEYVDDTLLRNPNFLLELVNTHNVVAWDCLEYLTKEIVCRFILRSPKNNHNILHYIPYELLYDIDVICTALTKFGIYGCHYFDETVFRNPELIKKILHLELPECSRHEFYNKIQLVKILIDMPLPPAILDILIMLL